MLQKLVRPNCVAMKKLMKKLVRPHCGEMQELVPKVG
jgi:hypothetical protein